MTIECFWTHPAFQEQPIVIVVVKAFIVLHREFLENLGQSLALLSTQLTLILIGVILLAVLQ